MPLTFNLRHLEKKNLILEGELSPGEMEMDSADELVHPAGSLEYDLEVEKQEKSAYVHGRLALPLTCECARCLRKYNHLLEIEDWSVLLEFEGEEKVPIHNDLVDLTPFIREDMFLAFPQHPLCDPECPGLNQGAMKGEKAKSSSDQGDSSPWAALDKLKI